MQYLTTFLTLTRTSVVLLQCDNVLSSVHAWDLWESNSIPTIGQYSDWITSISITYVFIAFILP